MKKIMALGLKRPSRAKLDADMRQYFEVCEEKIGFVPNVLQCYSFDQDKLRAFANFYNDLMLADSGLSKLEREMIAMVVSAANRCSYCLTAHGAAVRKLSGDPSLGEALAMNYRSAKLPARHRAMLDFAHKLTTAPAEVEEPDRRALRRAGFKDRDIWDVAAVASFFNMSNRFATAVDMQPNPEYVSMARAPRSK